MKMQWMDNVECNGNLLAVAGNRNAMHTLDKDAVRFPGRDAMHGVSTANGADTCQRTEYHNDINHASIADIPYQSTTYNITGTKHIQKKQANNKSIFIINKLGL
ncbi:MAG: hypothetical protein ACQER7_09555 [Bacteroidota bacterium]